jgi:hypothetical protein
MPTRLKASLLTARLVAQGVPVARATILRIAEEYDRLARRALARMKEETAPK